MPEMVNMVNGFFHKAQNFLYRLDHPFFVQNLPDCVVNIVPKKLQIVFWTSTTSNSKGIMEELERKI